MHDIYNPWHGCVKISDGCAHCYMYFLDRQYDRDGSVITRTKSGFKYPVQKSRDGRYKIRSGEHVRVCMTSDFFLEQADPWRPEVWDMLKFRSDVVWTLLTKRANRIQGCLPPDWDDGYPNISLGVTAENQVRADERVPVLLSVPARHKYVMCAPLIAPVDLTPYLASGEIEYVMAGGENYDGCRPCRYEWAYELYSQCRAAGVSFNFIETGTRFIYNNVEYRMPKKRDQSRQAFLSGLRFRGDKQKPYALFLPGTDVPVPPDQLYQKTFRYAVCRECASQFTCNGCADCGKCCCREPY